MTFSQGSANSFLCHPTVHARAFHHNSPLAVPSLLDTMASFRLRLLQRASSTLLHAKSSARFSSLVMPGDSCVTAFDTPLIPVHGWASTHVVNCDLPRLAQVTRHAQSGLFFVNPHTPTVLTVFMPGCIHWGVVCCTRLKEEAIANAGSCGWVKLHAIC